MLRYFPWRNFKHEVKTTFQQDVFHRLSSTESKTTSQNLRRYIKNIAYLLGAGVTVSLAYTLYDSSVRPPVCPNSKRNQMIDKNNVLSSTAVIKNMDQKCSGQTPMEKIGAITGVNYKLVSAKSNDSNQSSRILLNDEDIVQQNLFNDNYMSEYIETLADLIVKLDEPRRINLLSNIIGYYVFICPECRSSLTRQMISCSSYLNKAGLQNKAANVSEVENVKSQN